MRSLLALVCVVACARADVTVKSAQPSVTPILLLGALAAPDAGSVEIGGQLRVLHGPASVRRSLFELRDAAGRVVFSDGAAFHLHQGDSVGLGMSSSAGPTLPPSLPAGRYTASWTVDGVRSNQVPLTLGTTPPPLAVERAGALIVAHLYNPGPGDLDLLEAYERSRLIVDGRSYVRQGVEWDGSTRLPPHRAWAFVVAPADYGAPGGRKVTLEAAGHQAVIDGN